MALALLASLAVATAPPPPPPPPPSVAEPGGPVEPRPVAAPLAIRYRPIEIGVAVVQRDGIRRATGSYACGVALGLGGGAWLGIDVAVLGPDARGDGHIGAMISAEREAGRLRTRLAIGPAWLTDRGGVVERATVVRAGAEVVLVRGDVAPTLAVAVRGQLDTAGVVATTAGVALSLGFGG